MESLLIKMETSTGLRPELRIHATDNVLAPDSSLIRILKEDGRFQVPKTEDRPKDIDCVIVGAQEVVEWVKWSRMFKSQAGGDKINFLFDDAFSEDSTDMGSSEKFINKYQEVNFFN